MGHPAWEQEYIEYFTARAPALRRTAYAMCGDWQAAEDLVQTTFVRLYVHWHKVRQETIDAYARRILTNLFLNGRRTAVRERITDRVPEQVAPPPRTDDRLALASAMTGLTARQRAIVALRFIDDMPIAGVADVLGLAEGTVKSHSARALQTMRVALADSYDTGGA
ncbi:SigE family RNA polymerase sigma factor [Luteipulveratus mongoliensis]|uniref:RNA polymerase sigma70 factor n=1 Tax=Luteipulveratus mongoliensis TaxID=571913 RepID=A0A0K1JMR5_9MICO|nr:SigE family RNA polymerase sigma factor [Luteipulveratus mongoliensis]AKU18009.1 RNA polymerase sigma70 factor [Luteipulveratus mongoliensis]